ncbi:HlyD family secretion protein [Achromobacter aloeverae]|uniref:HlyD family secretion protein n=2 Tax=Achromobacter aloeverae TaxID=1750518 RepID=A0A4Q1HFY8_9BURK|nr:HlyD family secretion protein [Achromobacter aloeverae]
MAAVAIIAVLAVAWGVRWWLHARYMVETDDAYARADISTVSARVAGHILAVDARDNQQVGAGDILARIDDSGYQAKVAQATAALHAAGAEREARAAAVANLDARTRLQQSLIDEAEGAVRVAQAEAARAGKARARQRQLFDSQVNSAQQWEAAQADARKADAVLASARAGLEARTRELSVLATEKRMAASEYEKAQGRREEAEAVLAQARIALSYTVVRAPVGGLVGQRSVRVGAAVAPGTPLLAVVPGDVYVIANYKETQVGQLRPGQPAIVEVDAFDGLRLHGHVDSLAPASGAQFALLPPDNATGNFTKIVQRMPVKIVLDAGQPRMRDIRPGMSVIASVDTRHE